MNAFNRERPGHETSSPGPFRRPPREPARGQGRSRPYCRGARRKRIKTGVRRSGGSTKTLMTIRSLQASRTRSSIACSRARNENSSPSSVKSRKPSKSPKSIERNAHHLSGVFPPLDRRVLGSSAAGLRWPDRARIASQPPDQPRHPGDISPHNRMPSVAARDLLDFPFVERKDILLEQEAIPSSP